ncbi:hypothetical protein GCM10009636_08460 [Arthrobacter koreensis]|uniref:hypothetical protein n=1 Tax=Arthrobacter koreensis TaxID=199136 RepID=UPI001264CD64|nr:hypothetical protein [Arthrobacter koreensis]
MATNSPIKVSEEVDQLISHAAHFLGRSKKDLVDAAVRDYIEAHRDELNASIQEVMHKLDGSNAAVVSMMTGYTKSELDELGGVPE